MNPVDLGPSRSLGGYGMDEYKREKIRHWVVTTWLTVMLLGDLVLAIVYLVVFLHFHEPPPPPWAPLVATALLLVNVGFVIALLGWKKWAVYAFAINSIVAFGFILVLGLGIVLGILGLLCVPILYPILQMGTPRTAWQEME
jgi:hypothetical protein